MVQIGYDTAGEIQNTYSSAHSEFGEDPAFWVRYFSPSPAADSAVVRSRTSMFASAAICSMR